MDTIDRCTSIRNFNKLKRQSLYKASEIIAKRKSVTSEALLQATIEIIILNMQKTF